MSRPTTKNRLAPAGQTASPIDTGGVCVVVDSRSNCPAKSDGSPHTPKKAALDASMWCIWCEAYLGEAN